MKFWHQRGISRLGTGALALLMSLISTLGNPSKPEPILLVVMDPLAKELACACVKGYGQRDYRKLAARLEATLKQPVSIEFSDDLADSLSVASSGQEIIVIGERSLVAHGAKQADLKCHPVCELTDLEGSTTVTGEFVARADDPANELKDIAGRKVFLGLNEFDAKHTAALESLRAAKLEPPAQTETRASGNDAALDVLDSTASSPPVAVIPGYAMRLLEGCGSITPGDLKVIGKTAPVPFITVFLTDAIPAEKKQGIFKTLLNLKGDAQLLQQLESREGFKSINAEKPSAPQTRAIQDWPDWRGPNRDGRVPQLPKQLPKTATFIWKKAAVPGCLAGLSVSNKRLILAERDFSDEHDVYRCLNTENGELLWRLEFPARGQLDYGQSPRATPVIHQGKVYLLGAFGDLRCVDISDGKVLWHRQLPKEFKATLPTWGMCSPPLIVDDLLIVNPGAKDASLAALDCATGHTRWTTPGAPAAYAAFIYGEFGGRPQIVGYDQTSLGGWDVKTGKRLWQLVPKTEGDFNVPTPIAVNGGVIVSTENNGTRFHHFDESGCIIPNAAGEFADLAPDTATSVVSNGRLFGAHLGLYCLDVKNGLNPVWPRDETALGDHTSFIADDERVLVITLGGELILLDAKADDCAIISRLQLFDDDVEMYSHPAMVGTRLYARGGSSVVCVDLGKN